MRSSSYPNDTEGLHKLACYLMRAPVNLSRLRFDPDSGLLVYQPKSGHELDDDALADPLEFLARLLTHVPEPKKHLVHFYGAYANRVRSTLRDGGDGDRDRAEEHAPERRVMRKRWAELIYRIYEVDPLTCRRCGAQMKILAFISEPALTERFWTISSKKNSQPSSGSHHPLDHCSTAAKLTGPAPSSPS